LKDAEKWIQFRSILRQQIDAARKFQREYSGRDYENEALDNLENTIDSFAENVSKRITQLDELSQSLIEIVSILTTPTYHTSLICAVQRNHLRPRQSADMVIGV
jgi:hypothetical protein